MILSQRRSIVPAAAEWYGIESGVEERYLGRLM